MNACDFVKLSTCTHPALRQADYAVKTIDALRSTLDQYLYEEFGEWEYRNGYYRKGSCGRYAPAWSAAQRNSLPHGRAGPFSTIAHVVRGSRPDLTVQHLVRGCPTRNV
jgi:hypothetical protein